MKMPKIRFNDFKNEWKKEKLCNIVSRITRKNKNLESHTPLTISAIEGLVSQLTYFNNIVASSNISGYYLIKNGEFAYNKSYSNGFPYGSIKRLDKFDMGVLSTLYIVFALNKQNTSILSDYLVLFFNTTLWYHEVAKRAEEGARNHGLLNISADDFFDINIIYPKDLLEQQKIASYFQKLESLIQTTSKKLATLKRIKAASLQSMFPQEGETVPKVRFKEFEGEWEEKSFSALYKKSIIKNDLTFGTDKIISVANMYYLTNVNVSDLEYLKTYNIMKLGDIAFEGNKSKRFLHGRFVENTIGDGIVSHVFVVFHPISAEHDINYWKYAINNENIMRNVLIRCTKSSTMMTDLVVDDFLKETILVPTYAEQQKIGAYFRNLDRQISLQTQRLEKLKQIKAACLDKMFV